MMQLTASVKFACNVREINSDLGKKFLFYAFDVKRG